MCFERCWREREWHARLRCERERLDATVEIPLQPSRVEFHPGEIAEQLEPQLIGQVFQYRHRHVDRDSRDWTRMTRESRWTMAECSHDWLMCSSMLRHEGWHLLHAWCGWFHATEYGIYVAETNTYSFLTSHLHPQRVQVVLRADLLGVSGVERFVLSQFHELLNDFEMRALVLDVDRLPRERQRMVGLRCVGQAGELLLTGPLHGAFAAHREPFARSSSRRSCRNSTPTGHWSARAIL